MHYHVALLGNKQLFDWEARKAHEKQADHVCKLLVLTSVLLMVFLLSGEDDTGLAALDAGVRTV